MPSPNCSIAGSHSTSRARLAPSTGKLHLFQFAIRGGRRRFEAREAIQAGDFAEAMDFHASKKRVPQEARHVFQDVRLRKMAPRGMANGELPAG